jgi:hypothetical protein
VRFQVPLGCLQNQSLTRPRLRELAVRLRTAWWFGGGLPGHRARRQFPGRFRKAHAPAFAPRAPLPSSSNRLHGTLPPEFLAAWSGLEELNAGGNKLIGTLPAAWARFGRLRVLDLRLVRAPLGAAACVVCYKRLLEGPCLLQSLWQAR